MVKENVEVNVDAGNKGFEYSAYVNLTNTELTKFSTKRITKFRLYIYDNELSSMDGEKLKGYVNCIKTKS